MKRCVVQFDLDGVLADFSTSYDALCRKLGVPVPGPEAPWDAKWNQKVWAEIKASLDFWERLSPLVDDHALSRIDLLPAVADVYFVTARPGRHTKWQTESWLDRNGIDRPTVIVSDRKAEFAKAVGATHALDDKAGNAVAIQYMSRKTNSYLLDAPYNRWDQAVLGTKVKRVESVAAFLDAVEDVAWHTTSQTT